MMEAEWLRCEDPDELLAFGLPGVSSRKSRLFSIACCRRVWTRITDERHRLVIEMAERMADDPLAIEQYQAALQPVISLWANHLPKYTTERDRWEFDHYMTGATRHLDGDGATEYAARYVAGAVGRLRGLAETPAWHEARMAEEVVQAELIRDILGNPFRPVASADPRWLTSTSIALAEAIYAERAFDRLPVLADALAEAGCENADVLSHCRGPGPHVRGCWVVDLVLGKT